MGKIVKYCSSCDEGFAERFTFCPTCGASLQAFEMNPIQTEEIVTQDISDRIEAAPVTQPLSAVSVDEWPTEIVDEPAAVETANTDGEVPFEEPASVEDDVPVTVAVPAASSLFVHEPMNADEPQSAFFAPRYERGEDGGYYITVIEEKNVKQRNMLLLGSTVFCVAMALAATVYSLFDKALEVGAIDDGKLFSAVIVDEPMATEPEQQKNKDKDSGGGGGGGKEQPDPVNRGDLPDQSRTPTRPPDPTVPRLENPSLALPPPQTEGTRKFEKNYGIWGDPNSKFGTPSSGPGTGGGMGTGIGTGAGSGRGTGAGSGSGSGYGAGDGDGDGDGSGSGTGGRGGPPPKAAAVTTPLRIISKPRPGYTDAARTNGVQGTLRLRVTLLANGQIGSITPVTRLPHGLTEQAIAAARQIRFEPKKVNGVAQSVIQTIEYSFSLY